MTRVELLQVDRSDSGPAGLHPVQPSLIWRIFLVRKRDSHCGISQERGCIYSECSVVYLKTPRVLLACTVSYNLHNERPREPYIQ